VLIKHITVLSAMVLLTACQQTTLPQGDYQQLAANATEKPLQLVLQQGKISGFTGCNNAMGNYLIDKGELVVSQLATTMMACDPNAMDREHTFSQFLQSRPQVNIEGNTLTLSKQDQQYQFSLQPDLSQATTKLVYVAAQRQTCTGVAVQQCLQVRDSPQADWQLFYDEIEGFTPQPGVAYRLRIKEVPVQKPAADASNVRWILDMIIEQEVMSQ
jgi:heat shock protein HslJ